MTKPTLSHRFDPHAQPVDEAVLERLASFAKRWMTVVGNEQQLAQSFLNELCEALGTARPYDGTLPETDYCFEKKVPVPGRSEHGRIDLYKRGHFVLEAKCGRPSAKDKGSAPVRGTHAYWGYIQAAYEGQARFYAGLLDEGRPPALVVVDIGEAFFVWPRRDDGYPDFYSPERIHVPLTRLADEDSARLLRAVFDNPAELDRTRIQKKVTEEVAVLLAELSKALGRQHDPHEVARFLMRCIFCMFAEDVDLLPHAHFSGLLQKGLHRPAGLTRELTRLFEVMNAGGTYDFEPIRRFNGALFRDATALPLDAKEVRLLADVAALDWSFVDPSIFGTLLERALDPRERHRLGAHYTPRAYVERLVRATIDEPLRLEWEAVQARVDELLRTDGGASAPSKAKLNEARKLLVGFRARVGRVRVLDPACGTGNFLVVAYGVVKSLEHEALEALRALGGGQQGLALVGESVVPDHFLGLEVNAWAAEIAQLVLWMGHLQWEIHHRGQSAIVEPVLSDKRSIEERDALIEVQRRVARLDPATGQAITRWDGRTVKVHHVTGNGVPDETARTPVEDFIGVTRATWPEAEFIVGNPPFIGNKRMREALGDAYVDAVRGAFTEVPDTVDFVLYWWFLAAERVRAGQARRFGLITTNSLTQTFNRQVVNAAIEAEPPLVLVSAIADHPWVDRGAAVRIAMTVGERGEPGEPKKVRLGQVVGGGQDELVEVRFRAVERIHADLKGGADVASAAPLQANAGLSFQGMNLVGKGFRLTAEDVERLGYQLDALPPIVRPHINARELMQGRLTMYVIDAFGLTAEELQARWPTAYQWLHDHVKPERDQNRRDSRRKRWWIFGEPVGKLRAALVGLPRFIVTPETSKHRVFAFMDAAVCPDHKLYAFGSGSAGLLAVLSSRPHQLWSLASGGRQGVGNDPTYNNTRCFLTYPFPDLIPAHSERLAELGEALEVYRKDKLERFPEVTLTGLYNLLEKHRAKIKFTPKEQALHLKVGTDRLRELHDAIDEAVCDAYGWPRTLCDRSPASDQEIVVRLSALNAERAAEEAQGHVRSLRESVAAADVGLARTGLDDEDQDAADDGGDGDEVISDQSGVQGAGVTAATSGKKPFPSDPIDQFAAILQSLRAHPLGLDVGAVVDSFTNAPRKRVAEVLSRLADRGVLLSDDAGRYRAS